MNTLKARPENEDVNLKFLKALPPSWSQVTLVLKTKGGLEYLSFDDLYNKLKSLEKAFSSHGSVVDDVLLHHPAESEPKQQLAYEDLKQIKTGSTLLGSARAQASHAAKDHEDAHADEGALNIYGMIAGMESVSNPWNLHLRLLLTSEPNVVMSKVWTDAPIIEEVDSDNEYVVTPGKANEKPSHTDNKSAKFINTLRDMVCPIHIKGRDSCKEEWPKNKQWPNKMKRPMGWSGIVDLSSTRPNLSTPVPTGRQNLSKPVTTSRLNLPTSVPTGKAVPAGRPKLPIQPLHRAKPPKTSFSYFGGDKMKIAVKPSTGCSWSSSRYAISHDPFIYDSLVKQFWSTTSLRPAELGPPAIVATIDGAQYTISEACVRSNLQLADEGGAAEDQVNVPNPPIIAPTTTSPPRKGTNIPPSDHDQPSSSRLNEPDKEPLTFTFVEDETVGGSFHESPPRSHEATPSAGQPSGVAEDPLTLTALSFLVSKFMQKTTSLESELKDTKKILGTAIITFVGRVKKLEGALKKRKRKPVISDYDDDAEIMEKEVDMDSLLALANASLAEQQSSFVTPSKDKHLGEVAKSPAQVSSRSMKTYTRASKGSASKDTSYRMDFSPNAVTPGGLTHSSANQDIPADIFVTLGNMPISTGSGTIPAGVSVPMGSSTFPVGSEQVPPVSTSVDKGKAQLVDEQNSYSKEIMDLNPAQQRIDSKKSSSAGQFFCRCIGIFNHGKEFMENKELSRTLIGSNLPEGDFASAMVEMVDRKRRQIAEQKAKARSDRPMSQSLSADRLKEAFERLQSHLSTLTQQDFTRASKRLGDELEQPSSKRPKPAEVEVTSAAMEDTSAQLPIPSDDVRPSKESEVVEEKMESLERTPRKRKSITREADGVGLILWGDLWVLIDSPEVDDGSEF
ncbi:hypothetical protein Tco_1498998 [Tanacetum coccineum]